MTRRFIGVRWWLGAAFALVAAVSTAIVVSQFSTRSENAFRSHAEDLAAASAAVAAKQATPTRLKELATQQDLELRLYDLNGKLLAAAGPNGAPVSEPELESAALRTALAG